MTLRPHVPAVVVWLLVAAVTTHGQADPSSVADSEDIEPRTIGARGTTMVGFAGYVDHFFKQELPTNYTAQIDVGRFLARKIVARGGLTGSGSFGGDASDDRPTGSGAPALHAFGGVLYYFTPESMVSLFAGGEYWAQLTEREEPDAGAAIGTVGLQGAVSSRASLFVEAGYGIGLTRSDDGERLSRFVGRLGIRLKFGG